MNLELRKKELRDCRQENESDAIKNFLFEKKQIQLN
jgi:hypothetical protein